jgi:hypothetical protein
VQLTEVQPHRLRAFDEGWRNMHGSIDLAIGTPNFLPGLLVVKGDNDWAVQKEFRASKGFSQKTALRQRLAVFGRI